MGKLPGAKYVPSTSCGNTPMFATSFLKGTGFSRTLVCRSEANPAPLRKINLRIPGSHADLASYGCQYVRADGTLQLFPYKCLTAAPG